MEEYAVITGASSGIGKEFAFRLSKLNYNIILVARREDKLKKIASQIKTNTIVFSADLSNQEECLKLINFIKNYNVSIFINNAGFGKCEQSINIDETNELKMIDVNVKAVHLLTKLVLKQINNKEDTFILNVASIAGLLPSGPYMATYYATKSYITSFTQSIAKELKDNKSKTYIGCLCPGPVKTEFDEVANVKFSLKSISAEKCVSVAIKKMFQKKTIIIPTFKIKAVSFFSKIFPRKIVGFIVAKQQKRKIVRY